QEITAVISRVLDEDSFPDGDVERVEITCLPNGEATYRVWPARADEPIEGFYNNPDAPREQPA
ncbi:MAG TPA: hypothetical protein VEX36_12910, partial [Thermoleophilaceae bacterium]|nr:hypothetical protein [Thermoleophilaceae bacterium]